MALTPADWAGLCALTETNRPEEQEYVLWTLRNRAESPRFPDTYEAVVLQPKQFSAFNAYPRAKSEPTKDWPERVFNKMVKEELHVYGFTASRLLAAVHLAEKVLANLPSPFITLALRPKDFPASVLHYFSPVSMKPAGSAPAWAKSAKRLFTPPGIDPQRFVFAEAVP